MSLTTPSAPSYRRSGETAPLRAVVAMETPRGGAGLMARLAGERGIEVVAAADSLLAVVQVARERPVDVVLIDLAPTPRNLTRVTEVARSLPDARLVALGVVEVEEAMAWAEAGVAGFVERRDSIEELLEVLHSVMRGELRCSPQMGAALLRRVRELSPERPAVQLSRLTARELEIVGLIGEGLSNAEIARRMSLQVPTVKNHVRSIMQKLQVRSRIAVAAMARAGHAKTRPSQALQAAWARSPSTPSPYW